MLKYALEILKNYKVEELWGAIYLSNIKVCYKATLIKIMHYWHRKRPSGNKNIIESSEMYLSVYVNLI